MQRFSEWVYTDDRCGKVALGLFFVIAFVSTALAGFAPNTYSAVLYIIADGTITWAIMAFLKMGVKRP